MLRLKSISLLQFKNYQTRTFGFRERITGICGNNGTGKTNLLDAIHYLCFTKSYFNHQDSLSVKSGQAGFRIEGEFELSAKPEMAVCILRETGKKEFLLGNIPYEKFSRHIGRYPCVIIAPDDAGLITGKSDHRRKFIDSILCQISPDYLEQLICYVKVLQQRNSLLKSFLETGARNYELLDIIDSQLVQYGNFVFNKRKEFLVSFLAEVIQQHNDIAGKNEHLNLSYESQLLQAPIDELLLSGRERDCLSIRTNIGVHRDDIEMKMNESLFKNTASQGQRKNLLFALKLAELKVLGEEKGFSPLLLLDDVFEKLDEDRMGNLLKKVCIENDGQVFITDTDPQRLAAHLKLINCSFETIQLAV